MFRLGLASQPRPNDGDIVALVDATARRAAALGVDVLIFPEGLMTSLLLEPTHFADAAETLEGPFMAAMRAIAQHHAIWLIVTMNERAPEGPPYNTAAIIDEAGTIRGTYRKTHLFDAGAVRESSRMQAGDRLFSPIATPFCTLGMGICYDLRFPEVARAAALDGAETMVFPAAWVDGPCKQDQWIALLKARAIENGMYVAGLSRPDEGCVGSCCVFDPLGREVKPSIHGDGLAVASIDSSLVAKTRAAMPALSHRRVDLY